MQLRGTVGGEYSSLSNIVNTVFLLQMVQDKPTHEESHQAVPLFFPFSLDLNSESLLQPVTMKLLLTPVILSLL